MSNSSPRRPSFEQRLKVVQWIQMSEEWLKAERPHMAALCRIVHEATGVAVAEESIKRLVKASGITWEPMLATGHGSGKENRARIQALEARLAQAEERLGRAEEDLTQLKGRLGMLMQDLGLITMIAPKA